MNDQTRLNHQEQMFQMIEEFKKSGNTRKVFCATKNLAINVFYYWQRKYREQSQGLPQGSFIMVKTGVKPQQCNYPGPVITIQYPNGVSMQVPSDASLQVLRSLVSLI